MIQTDMSRVPETRASNKGFPQERYRELAVRSASTFTLRRAALISSWMNHILKLGRSLQVAIFLEFWTDCYIERQRGFRPPLRGST
jgi:hypothetical protein